MPAWNRAVATMAILTAVAASGGPAARAAAAPQTATSAACECEDDLLAALDARIQERFRTVDNRRFGYARMATVRSVPHTFDAENVRETAALVGLERANLRVVMYLASRGVLAADDPSIGNALRMRPLIKGPVVVTPHRAAAGGSAAFPAPAALLPDSRRAMRAFAAGVKSTEFAQGDWNFIARPVRVSDDRCLTCHHEVSAAAAGNSLRIGDPLGAVLYGYQPMR